MIELIVHCYAIKLPQYATLLRYQLASMVKWVPHTNVKVTVCCSPFDTLVTGVLNEFSVKNSWLVKSFYQSEGSLFRRSIGRYHILTELDDRTKVIWYTDCDHVFGEACIDTAYKLVVGRGRMVYPRKIKISKSHEIGDWQIEEGKGPHFPEIYPADFVTKRYNRPIGGTYIIDADFVREHGYLPDSKWQNPRKDGKPFKDFRDDVAFRKYVANHSTIEAVNIPNLYRVRHSRTTH